MIEATFARNSEVVNLPAEGERRAGGRRGAVGWRGVWCSRILDERK